MAYTTGLHTKYNMIGIREDLSDVIYRITPTETPFLNGAGKGPKVSNTLFEWQTDDLAAVDTTNAHLEGDDAVYATPAPTVRVGNYCQIFKKTLNISGTAQAINAAGRKSERALLIAKKGAELKRDMESIFLMNQGGEAGGTSTARLTATLGAWVKTNDSIATDGGSPAYTSGVPAAARTDGTQRAFTETILKAVISSCWTSGNVPRILMLGAHNKGLFSHFDGVVTWQYNVSGKSQATIMGAAEIYISDFGEIRAVPNRFQRARDAWLIDFEYVSVSYLRPFKTEPLAKTGDSDKEQMVVECGLRVNQEAALGLAADLSES